MENQKPGISIGSASIVMVFAVLCLTVFAVLSLVTANSEKKLAEKAAAAVSDYYAADFAAAETYEKLAELTTAGDLSAVMEAADSLQVDVSVGAGGALQFRYSQPIDPRQKLDIELHETDGTLQIIRWQAVDTEEWTTDPSLPVWDGE